MGAPHPEELDAVFQRPQEAVGGVQGGGVLASDVAAGRQCGERVEGAGAAQGGIAAAVDQLEKLDGEFDVAQAARAEFELAFDAVGGDVLDHPQAHLAHIGDEVLALGGLPDHRLHRIDIRLAEVQIAGHRAGLEQGLELPGLGPALVVGEMAGEGADQRAVAALGAQIGVHRPDGALDGDVRAQPHHAGGEPGCGLEGLGLLDAFLGLGHEDDVHVGDVIELAGAAFAHGDDGQPGDRGVAGRLLVGDLEGGPYGRGGQIRQLRRGLGDIGRPAHIAGHDPQQAAAVGDAQRIGARAALAPLPPDALGERLLELGGGGVQIHRFVGDQRTPVARVPGEVVGERLGRAHHPQQPVAQRFGRDQGAQQFLLPLRALGLHQPGQPQQRQVGVGGAAQCLQ